MARWLGLAGVVLIAALAAPVRADGPVQVTEPEGLWTGVMASDTPATLAGAEVIDVPALEQLLGQKPLLIDVGLADRKPDNLPASTIWKPIHRSIPGAVWFPGAGPGDLPADRADALLRRVSELANGNKAQPVVTFCKPRCWGSWNVAKRLVEAGYTSVYWLPAGIDGWQERHDTVIVQPEAGWAASEGAS
jgi:PQQ-dependent catabolism-associated CXXCW motif protein